MQPPVLWAWGLILYTILAFEAPYDLATHHLSSLVSPLLFVLRSPCLLSFLLILQVPPHLWAFAHAVPSAWNASPSLSFAQLTLPHHWILNVTSSGKFSLIPLEWVRPSVKCGHIVCKPTHDMKAFPMPPPDLLSNHSVLHTLCCSQSGLLAAPQTCQVDPASASLHLLFPVPGALFPLLFVMSQFKCHHLGEALLTPQMR